MASAISTMLAPMMAYLACRRIQRAHDTELALDILNQLESSSDSEESSQTNDEKVSSNKKKKRQEVVNRHQQSLSPIEVHQSPKNAAGADDKPGQKQTKTALGGVGAGAKPPHLTTLEKQQSLLQLAAELAHQKAP